MILLSGQSSTHQNLDPPVARLLQLVDELNDAFESAAASMQPANLGYGGQPYRSKRQEDFARQLLLGVVPALADLTAKVAREMTLIVESQDGIEELGRSKII